MSWIRDNTLTWIQKLAVYVVGSGLVPQHVAFIMDGNRRYAKKHKVQKIEGHSKGLPPPNMGHFPLNIMTNNDLQGYLTILGHLKNVDGHGGHDLLFDRLAETLHWCLELGIKEVTVYAFSIENFKRTKEEIDALMDLARQKFQRLLDEEDKLMEHGVHIRIIGNLNLLPVDLQKMMAKAMFITRNNSKAVLNIAYAYTAREEITQCVKQTVEGVVDGVLSPSNVTQDLLSKTLYTNHSPTPDLLIRTSGEVRLSDFLLWQVSCSCVYFTDVLWPDFTVWHLLAAVFYYQRCHQHLEDAVLLEKRSDKKSSNQGEDFVDFVNHKRKLWLSEHANLEVNS